MCKKCEMCPHKGITMILNPLDPAAMDRVEMPQKWQELEKRGLDDDLRFRGRAHMAWILREGEPTWERNARAFLAALARGFLEPFDRSRFKIASDDPHRELKINSLNALDELSAEFGARVSSVMWNSLAHLATRSEPEIKTSILKEADTLPHHFGIVDTMLHAMGKVYTFSLRVQAVFFKHTGMVLVHNCDCNCSLLNMKKVDGCVHFTLTKEERFEATQSLIVHKFAESHLILNSKLPFEYTITGDATALLGSGQSASCVA